MHGYGEPQEPRPRHDAATCVDPVCGRCFTVRRHRRPAGAPDGPPLRAGEDPTNYDSRGNPLVMPPTESAGYDPRLTGNPDEMIEALTEMAEERDEAANIESLMQREVHIAGHSHGSSRNGKREKNSDPVCQECHLQRCVETCPCRVASKRCPTCVASKRRGAYKKQTPIRSKMVTARVSRAAKVVFEESDESVGVILETIAQYMRISRKSWSEVAREFGLDPALIEDDAA